MDKPSFVSKFGSVGTGPGQLFSPQGVAYDQVGEVIYVAELGKRIQKFALNGALLGQVTGVTNPAQLAVDADGNLYIADRGQSQIEKRTPLGAVVWAVGGVSWPQGVAVTPDGTPFIADTFGYRVKRLQKDGADGPTLLTGVWGRHIAVDPAGEFYVCDSPQQRVLKGSAVFIQPGTSDHQIRNSSCIALAEDGTVLVSDSYWIKAFEPDGSFLWKLGGYGSNDGQFRGIGGIAHANGKLVVADTALNRVQVFA